MLKKTIRYTDFDGVEKSTVAYFNLSKTECVDMNLEYEAEGGLIAHLKNILATREDGKVLQKPAIDFVKLMLEKSYGVRPANDPTLFLKEDENGKLLFNKFKQSAAYDAYVFALLSGEEPLDEFAENVMPRMDEAQKAEAQRLLKEEGLDKLIMMDQVTG